MSDKVSIEFDAIEFKIPFEKPGAATKDKQRAAAKPAPKKEDKPREEKISLEACVARLQVPALRALLEETESRYKEDSDRVLRVADFLLSAFDQCSMPVRSYSTVFCVSINSVLEGRRDRELAPAT